MHKYKHKYGKNSGQLKGRKRKFDNYGLEDLEIGHFRENTWYKGHHVAKVKTGRS